MQSRRRACVRLIVTFALPIAAVACTKSSDKPAVTLPFSDDFSRGELGPNYYPSGGFWTVKEGYAYTTGANNAPCFVNVDLPKDVVIEVDVMSETPTVDSKIELMTDGRAHQSGYVFILGGWDNKLSVIARLDEHGKDRKEMGPTRVVGNRNYRWRIEKNGGALKWYLDGELYMTYDDPNPLDGDGNNRLAFSNWQNRIRYDNLKIWAYADAPPPTTTSTTGSPR